LFGRQGDVSGVEVGAEGVEFFSVGFTDAEGPAASSVGETLEGVLKEQVKRVDVLAVVLVKAGTTVDAVAVR